jgi:hypothetical protein
VIGVTFINLLKSNEMLNLAHKLLYCPHALRSEQAPLVNFRNNFMKSVSIFAGLLLTLSAGFAHAAPIFSLSAAGETTTSVAGAVTIDFESGCGYESCVGQFQIVTGSVAGQYAQPAGTSDYYLAVPNPQANGSVLLTLGTTADYFGLYWGSVDTYNSITFYLGGVEVGSFGGLDIAPPADGNQQAAATNRYVNFWFQNGDTYDAVRLASNGFAFESDNHAYSVTASVPEPATVLLMLTGLLGLMGARKRQA